MPACNKAYLVMLSKTTAREVYRPLAYIKPKNLKITSLLIVSLLALHLQGQVNNMTAVSTKAHLEFVRDVRLPIKLERLRNKLEFFKEHVSPNYPIFKNSIRELEDELEASICLMEELKDSVIMMEMTKAERELMIKVLNNKKLKKKYDKLWNKANQLAKERAQFEARLQFYSYGGLRMLDAGITLVRFCDPNESAENRALARQKLDYYRKSFPVRGGFDNTLYKGFFADHVNTAHKWLDKTDPYLTKVFNGKSGEEFITEVYGDGSVAPFISLAGYSEKRDSLVSLGWAAIQKCKDPIIVAARELVILMDNNKKIKEELDAKDVAIRSEMERAYFEVYGIRVKIINDDFDFDFDRHPYYN